MGPARRQLAAQARQRRRPCGPWLLGPVRGRPRRPQPPGPGRRRQAGQAYRCRPRPPAFGAGPGAVAAGRGGVLLPTRTPLTPAVAMTRAAGGVQGWSLATRCGAAVANAAAAAAAAAAIAADAAAAHVARSCSDNYGGACGSRRRRYSPPSHKAPSAVAAAASQEVPSLSRPVAASAKFTRSVGCETRFRSG